MSEIGQDLEVVVEADRVALKEMFAALIDDTDMTEGEFDDMIMQKQALEGCGIPFEDFCDHRVDIIAQILRTIKRERTLNAIWSKTRHATVTPELIAKTWNVSLEKATKMMRITMQRGVRHGVHPLHRKYRAIGTNLNRRRIKGHWYCDYLHAWTKLVWSNTGGLLFTNGEGFKSFYPSQSKSGDELGKCYS